MVKMVCSFQPGDGERIERGTIEVAVDRQPPGVPDPVVWSLSPRRLMSAETSKRTTTIGAKFKIIDPNTTFEQSNAAGRVLIDGERRVRPRCHLGSHGPRPCRTYR